MRRISGGASLAAVALLCLVPAGSRGQNQKNNKGQMWTKSAPIPATPQDYSALMNLKQLPGTVYYLDTNGTKTMTLRVDIPQMTPNPNYKPPTVNLNNRNMGNMNHHQQMAHLMQQHHQNMSRNPAQAMMHQQQMQMQMQNMAMQQMMQANMRAQQYQMQMMQAMAKASSNPNNQPFKVNITTKDFDLDILEKVSVRKTFLGTEYDDMGNPKQYTKSQLAELRGKDTSKPGYTAKFEDIQPGQEVMVFLSKPAKVKSAAASVLEPKKVDEEKEKKAGDEEKKADDDKKADAKKADDKKKADDNDKPAAADAAPLRTDRPVISMIVMTKELTAPLNNDAQAPAGKKKKN